MNWYINDLSLDGQFSGPAAFREALEPLMRVMSSRRDLQGRIFCTRDLPARMVTPNHSLPQAVRAANDPLFASLVLRWVSKAGPFWDTDRTTNPDDLFCYEEEDVTNQGLGEAGRRLISNLPAASFSFAESDDARFAMSPLRVVHGLVEEPLGTYDVTNVWTIEKFPPPVVERLQSWQQMLRRVSETMPGLLLSDEITSQLAPRPFDPGAAEHMLSLLGVLQRFTEETQDDGGWTAAGMELYGRYCMRKGARISDSSDAEKVDFKRDLTFLDPNDPSEKLFCPWHAKLNFGAQYRIHFAWPRPKGQRKIKVVYIGSKITRY
ncbi:MAG TPA: hypothetical protein VHW09_06380 [Bryobacteraceae bacterium]|nr:hypothetical protein [Bryobacteraceae bacterium]